MPAIYDLANLATLASLAVAIAALYISYRTWVEPRRHARQLAREFGASAFDDQQIQRSLKGYVEPDCSQLDPAGEDDIRQLFAVRSPLVPMMDRLLSDRHEGKHVLLLADSGMGKTSFLLHYYARNRRRNRVAQQRIAVVPLGRPDADDTIDKIEAKQETIVFLDAFDEDVSAIHDHRARLEALMQKCAQFRRIVVSCRTQFFPNEEEIPRQTGIARVEPRRAGQARIYQFYKLYLAPFSDSQVQQYIRKRVGIFNFTGRRRAYQIVQAIPELSVRPMLLALVPDLVARKRLIAQLYELYQFMVESWLDREEQWISKNALRQFSELLAVDLYIRRESRGMERIPRGELAALVHLQTSEVEAWQLTSRSLLNRDPEGNFKFAHRSIMEYLFISALTKGDRAPLTVKWTDLMRQLFISWCSAEIARGRFHAVTELLHEDFRMTGLFPIFKEPRAPASLTKSKILKPVDVGAALSLYAQLQQVPRTAYAQAIRLGEAVFICDLATDTIFWFPLDLLSEDDSVEAYDLRQLFYLTRASAQNQTDALNRKRERDREDWRAPTLEEFDLLLLLNQSNSVLREHAFYWLSDRTVKDAWLLATLDRSMENRHQLLDPIGLRALSVGEQRNPQCVVLSMRIPGGEGFSTEASQFKAFLVLVSHGDADEFLGTLLENGGCRVPSKLSPASYERAGPPFEVN